MNENDYINIVKGIINTANNSDPAYILNNDKYSISDFYTLINSDDFKKAGYNAVLNADGSVRTYTYTNTNGQIDNSGSNVDGGLNSNTQTGTASGTVEFTQPLDTTLTTATETVPSVVEANGTMSKFTNGVNGVGHFVFGSVKPAIGAAAIGIALGKIIDKGIYEVGTNVFGSDKLEAFNPDTWGTITAGNDSLGAKAFNTIFGINPDTGNTQMYMDEKAFAYLAMYYKSLGAFISSFDKPAEKIEGTDNYNYVGGAQSASVGKNQAEGRLYTNIWKLKPNSYKICGYTIYSPNTYTNENYTEKAKELALAFEDANKRIRVLDIHTDAVTESIFKQIFTQDNYSHSTLTDHNEYAIPMENYYYKNGLWFDATYYTTFNIPIFTKYDDLKNYFDNNNYDNAINKGLKGITSQDGAKTPDLSNANTIEEALNALKNQYPELWDNRVENNVVQPDGTTKTYTYIPVPMPTGGVGDKPTTPGASQDKPSVNPADATDTLRKTIIKILTQPKPVGMVDTAVDPVNPNPPDTGSGKTPILTPPTGASNALYSIYNPTQSQLNSFGAWLWSSNFVDQILKVFNDPMQAIIGLHKVFAKPSISGTGNIKVGYLDSGVSSNIVGGQYTTVDCGSVNLYEYYGNVFDYDPYTKINLYLPFIGIVPLNTGEVMRSIIHVVYHIDVLTGACLAEVKIIRDMAGGTLYQYTGNAAVQYPISSGSYMGIVSGILSIAGGIAGTIATGGAAMPVLLGAGASVGRMHTDISHSGSFSGNAGAMGIKKPYLIIDRPQSSLANNFQNYIGYPSNHTDTLGSCSGYVRVKEVHLEGIPATQNELKQIESILKEGVII